MKSLEKIILQIRPDITSIISIESYRPDYLFFPAQIKLELSNGEIEVCVVKTNSNKETILFEVEVLNALEEIGLQVPKVKSKVFKFIHEGVELAAVLIQELNGKALDWLGLNDLNLANITCQLTIQAVNRLHALTPDVLSHKVSAVIPKKTLSNELEFINENVGDWIMNPIFNDALELVKRIIPDVTTSLVFSNGDYNPLNFIAEEKSITGWIDFEYACFEDPYIGFAKFLLWADDNWGWSTGKKSGLVEKYLFANRISPTDFYIRLILRGLYYIVHSSPKKTPEYMLNIVEKYTKLVQL